MKAAFLAVVFFLFVLALPALGKVCAASPVCDDGNPCTFDNCLSKICINPPVENDTPCGTNMVCRDGNCVAASIVGEEPQQPQEPPVGGEEETNGTVETGNGAAPAMPSFKLPWDFDLSEYFPYFVMAIVLLMVLIAMAYVFQVMNRPPKESGATEKKVIQEISVEKQKKKVLEDLKHEFSKENEQQGKLG